MSHTINSDSTIKVWDTKTGKEYYTYKLRTSAYADFSIASNGQYLAVEKPLTVIIIDMVADTVKWQADLREFHFAGEHPFLQFSPDNQSLMVNFDLNSLMYKVDDGKIIWKRSEVGLGIGRPRFSRDNKYVISGASQRSEHNNNYYGLIVYTVQAGRYIGIYNSRRGMTSTVAFSPNSSRLTLGGDLYSDLYEWDITADTFVRDYNEYANGDIAFLMNDTSLIAINGIEGTTIYSTNPTFKQSIHNGVPSGSSSAVNPYDSSIAYGRNYGGNNGYLLFYDLDNLQIQQPSGGVYANDNIPWDRLIYDLTFSGDGAYLAVASEGRVVLCDGRARTIIAPLPSDSLRFTSVSFAPDNSMLAAANNSGGFVSLWNPATQEALPPLRAFDDSVRIARFSSDGKLLAAVGNDSTIRIFSVADWSLRRILRGHTGRVNDIAFANGANRLVSVSSDQTVRVWDAETGEAIAVNGEMSEYYYNVAISRDNRYIGVGGVSGVYLFSASNSLGVERGDEHLVVLPMELRPNPASERCALKLGMEWLGEPNPKVRVIDMMGRSYEVGIAAGRSLEPGLVLELETGGLVAGSYVVEVAGRAGRSVGRLMVVR